jgi:hypothetical protein
MTAVLLKWLDPSLESADGGRKLPSAKPAAELTNSEHSRRRATIAVAHFEPTCH